MRAITHWPGSSSSSCSRRRRWVASVRGRIVRSAVAPCWLSIGSGVPGRPAPEPGTPPVGRARGRSAPSDCLCSSRPHTPPAAPQHLCPLSCINTLPPCLRKASGPASPSCLSPASQQHLSSLPHHQLVRMPPPPHPSVCPPLSLSPARPCCCARGADCPCPRPSPPRPRHMPCARHPG